MNPKIKIFDLLTPEGQTAQRIFESARHLPLICPHGHVDPALFVSPDYRFCDPTHLFIIPDHYITRMLVSQGVAFPDLGISSKNGSEGLPSSREIWKRFCDHYHLFTGTPSGLWIENELAMVFGVSERPNAENAMKLYGRLQGLLQKPEFSPRSLFETFGIEVLCTTDSALDTLEAHQRIRQTSWQGKILPTFRPDALLDATHPDWIERIKALSALSGEDADTYDGFIRALENRRAFFRSMGAVATDHAVQTAFTCRLSPREADNLFDRALQGRMSPDEGCRFTGHMLLEMARMSVEDGLVMQIHVGAYRNHNPYVSRNFGPDRGFDLPQQVEWTRNLKPLLDAFGMNSKLRLILFTLDESSYSRELAPIAGAYPAVRLGPPWWFHDSPNGMMRYFERVMETAGIFNTVGFNDDTRAFLSIPARHDLWRRMSAVWLAKLVHRGQLSFEVARDRMQDLSYDLAKKGYRLEKEPQSSERF